MKINKYINPAKAICLIACTLLLNSGCDDFLEEKDIPRITGDFYTTKAGIISAVDATYSYMRFGVGGEYSNFLTEFGNDVTTGADGGAAKATNLYSSLSSGSGGLYTLWDNHYKGINVTNEVMQSLPNIDMTDLEKKTYSAEMHFFRGYFYFDLVQQFGRIPLVTVAEKKVRTDFKRASVADIYNLIISDLRHAEENLRETPAKQGQATVYAAAHLLSKVYLTRGSAVTDQRGQKPSDMDSALHYAKKVIANTKFGLVDNFADLWKMENMGNKEVVFSLQFTNNLIYNGSGNLSHLYWCSPYEKVPGIIRDIENGRPYAHHRVTNKTMFELFDRKNDSRFYKSFKWVNYCNSEVKDGSGKVIMAIGDTAIYYSLNPPKSNRSYAYTYFQWNKDDESKNNSRYPSLIKYFDNKRESINETKGGREWVRMRLGETYLIAAEAAGRNGDFTTAAYYINEIRKRAAWKDGETKMAQYWVEEGGTFDDKNSTYSYIEIQPSQLSSNFVDFILDERGRELLGEYMRWEDLVRCEKLVEYVTRWNSYSGKNIKDYHKLRPIPQSHIDRINPRGTNEEEQNPGYF